MRSHWLLEKMMLSHRGLRSLTLASPPSGILHRFAVLPSEAPHCIYISHFALDIALFHFAISHGSFKLSNVQIQCEM